jgi:hypothetical protein
VTAADETRPPVTRFSNLEYEDNIATRLAHPKDFVRRKRSPSRPIQDQIVGSEEDADVIDKTNGYGRTNALFHLYEITTDAIPGFYLDLRTLTSLLLKMISRSVNM